MTRRERLEAKLAKREEWASKAQGKADARFESTRKLADSILLGQPILVGHHSEGHARRDAEWKEIPPDGPVAPLSCAEDFMISHRTNNFTASWRPKGRHVHVGSFTTLDEAKAACEGFRRGLGFTL